MSGQKIYRREIGNTKFDFDGNDFVIAFNEPKFKQSRSGGDFDLDAKLNARLVTYFLPAFEIAEKLDYRPRLFFVSGLNMALDFNAKNEEERKIIIANNKLKFDFLQSFFDKFFPETFSVIEYIVSQDVLRVSDEKLLQIWKVLEEKYPEETKEVKVSLARFVKSSLFNDLNSLSEEALAYLNGNPKELLDAIKYALSHLFALGDINFSGNYYLGDKPFVTVGGHHEEIFNIVRKLSFEFLNEFAHLIFDQEVFVKDNHKIVIETESNNPVPYNGFYSKKGKNRELQEVTYENERELSFYDEHKKLSSDLDYLYKFVSKENYEKFWNEYRNRYFDLKERYREAYKINKDW
jgi:hypothetical protein